MAPVPIQMATPAIAVATVPIAVGTVRTHYFQPGLGSNEPGGHGPGTPRDVLRWPRLIP